MQLYSGGCIILLMIEIQIIFVLLFALNMIMLWSAILSGRLLGYRFIAYALFLLIPMVTVYFDQPHFELDYYWWIVAGYAAIVLGSVSCYLAKQELKINGAQWFQARQTNLVTAGLYQYLRHPIYLGLIFSLVGWWWVWSAVYSFYFGMFMLAMIWLHGYLEERLLMEKIFGQAYLEYKQRTGMFWVK